MNFKYGILHGIIEYYDFNGKVYLRLNYENGLKHGLHEKFHSRNTLVTY